jgi:uncharacterized membrane protein
VAAESMREALDRIADWEAHHKPTIPLPHRPPFKRVEERMADSITLLAGSMRFIYLHGAWFGIWVVVNLGLVAAALGVLPPFDPFPFGLLTMIVSLEAIFLSTFVMISQNRQAAVADHRSEQDYQVNLKAESEIAKLLILLEPLVAYHAELAAAEPRQPDRSSPSPGG